MDNEASFDYKLFAFLYIIQKLGAIPSFSGHSVQPHIKENDGSLVN